jgi:hypothetical protein
MDREDFVPQRQWETPEAQEIGVSAECSAYMGVWQDKDWD